MATFGGIPFKRKKDAVLIDEEVRPIFSPRKELLQRLQADRCEICESRDGGASPSHPQARRSAEERADSRPVRASHGRQAEEDPGALREMPCGRSCWTPGRRQRSKQQVTEKPDDIERVTSGLAGGRRERDRKITSPAAYPTTILRRANDLSSPSNGSVLRRANRARAASRVNAFGSSPSVTSFQSSGVETVAPGTARRT